jgi:hypothetical protein
MKDSSEIIKAYLQHYRLWHVQRSREYRVNPHFDWASEEVDKICSSPSGLNFVFELLQACENDAEIHYVAAGPLENLIRRHHQSIKEELSKLVRQHALMRKAIHGVWITKEDPARKTFDKILKKYGISDR